MTTTIRGTDNSAAAPALTGNDPDTGIYFPAANTLGLVTGGTEAVRVDSSGNVGIGVTPSAWTSIKASQVVNASFGGLGGGNYSAANVYYDGANWKYITSNYATLYQQSSNAGDGFHKWYIAPSGTAGDTISFTQAMTLDASGNVGIGVTPSAWGNSRAIEIFAGGGLITTTGDGSIQLTSNSYFDGAWKYKASAAAANYYQLNGTHVWRTASSGTAGNPISWTEAMRINTSGNLVFPNGQGIDFSASAGGGTTSSLLDDYEEGTWDSRPSTSPSSVSLLAGWTVSNYQGYYTKIGNRVFCSYYFEWSNSNSSSSTLYLVMPFAVAGTGNWNGNGTEVSSVDFPAGTTYVTIRPENSSTHATFKACGDNVVRVDMTFAMFGANASGYSLGSFNYKTN